MRDPKEYAKELVESFMNVKSHKMSDDSRIEWPTAKACAKIAVNRIKDEMIYTDIMTYVGKYCVYVYEFMDNVLIEIDNL